MKKLKNLAIISIITLVPAEGLFAQQSDESINYIEKKQDLEAQKDESGEAVVRLEPIVAIADEIPVEECFEIEEINFPGATLLSDALKEEFTREFFGGCDKIPRLNELTKRVHDYYIEEGYITSQVYMKPQDLSDGVIDITVLEGRVEKVDSKIYTGLIYPGYEGELLNIDELKSSLKMLNVLKSKRAKMTLKPGKKSAHSIVKIDYEKRGREVVSYFNFNNNFGKELEWVPMGLGIEWENPLNAFDTLSIQLNRVLQANNKDIALGSAIAYALPVYRFVFSMEVAQFTYDQSLRDVNYNYNSDGRSEVYSGGASYLAYNSRSNRLELELGVDYKQNRTFLPNAYARGVDYRMAIGSAALKHTYYGASYFVDTRLEYNHGRASDMPLFDRDFDKVTGELSLTKYFEPQIPLIYSLVSYGQMSNNVLPGSEQISIGGPNTVRGHKYLGVAGSSGAYARNELLYENRMRFANVYPYLAFDYGRVRCLNSSSCGELYGGAVGVRLQEKNFNFNFFYGAPLQVSEQKTLSQINISMVLNY